MKSVSWKKVKSKTFSKISSICRKQTTVSNIEAIKTILDIEVGFSFFPKDGIFEQLISTGTFELIKNNELKRLLLEMFNHQGTQPKVKQKIRKEFDRRGIKLVSG